MYNEWRKELTLLQTETLTKEQLKLGSCTRVQTKRPGIPEVSLDRGLLVTWDSSVQLMLIGLGSFVS